MLEFIYKLPLWYLTLIGSTVSISFHDLLIPGRIYPKVYILGYKEAIGLCLLLHKKLKQSLVLELYSNPSIHIKSDFTSSCLAALKSTESSFEIRRHQSVEKLRQWREAIKENTFNDEDSCRHGSVSGTALHKDCQGGGHVTTECSEGFGLWPWCLQNYGHNWTPKKIRKTADLVLQTYLSFLKHQLLLHTLRKVPQLFLEAFYRQRTKAKNAAAWACRCSCAFENLCQAGDAKFA